MPQKLPPPWLRYRWIANRALLIAVPLASLVGFTAMYAAMPIPREWFLVPLFVIDEAVEKIRDGSITGYVYDPTTAALKQAGN